MSRYAVNPFDFEQPAAREIAFLVLLVAAVLSPNISMPGELPAVRLEQVLLAGYLPVLGLYYYSHRETWRVGLVDLAFVALGIAIAITLVLAPLLLDAVSWSLRDPFELARVVEYWVLYRLALTVEPRRAIGSALVALPAMAVFQGAFAFVQYLDPGGFNEAVTGTWAVAHNLDGVERAGRTVGTIGNANYFGAFAGLLLVGSLAVIVLQRPNGLVLAGLSVAVLLSTFAVVSSQSRTAVLALLFAMTIALALVVLKRRARAAYATGIGLFVASAVLSITFVQVVQPDVGSFAARFAPSDIADDSSLTIRFSRWKSLFAGFFESAPSFCEGERLEQRRIGGGHEPANGTGLPEADAAAIARDEQRKEDVADIGRAVLDYFCSEGDWPTEAPLDEELVPDFIDELPVDPATGEPYRAYVSGAGFLVGAQLENAADPEGPLYTLGTIPNIASNPSFESGSPPARWGVTGEAVASSEEEPLFGEKAARVEAEPGGGYFDTVVFDFGRDESYTVGLWVRPEGSGDVEMQLYLTATMADGTLEDPFAERMVTLAGDAWTHVDLTFETPEEGRVTLVQVILRVPGEAEPVNFLVDGATLTLGTLAPGFVRITDTDPARLRSDDLPRFSDSPIIGAGPRKDIELGTVDNEYGLFLDRYGLLGTVAYLALFAGAFLIAWRAWWRSEDGVVQVMALTMVTFTALLALFNVTAGSYYHFQIMAVYWLFIGALGAAIGTGWRLGRQDG